ncbi:uncharacterized protein [Halyomorpha halys]|uniref:uncharacterized protein isoform X2 n=1 Tax=Halyomorpha halys TaxID=286706 RepID=UPI0006D5126B|nr:uncharacterized protein LOC106678637 isoform X2 [Halyomorpha halys]
MPRKHKKRNHFKKESVTEGFRKLEITENTESKTNEFLYSSNDLHRNGYLRLKRCASENSLKINSESLTQLCTRSEPSLHETVALRGTLSIPRRKSKKLRFSHEVLVLCYHNNKPTIKQIQPLADERDQQKRSYRYRSIRKPIDTVFWPNV